MIVRRSRPLLWVFALLALPSSCSSGDDGQASAQIRKFCQDLFASPAFACCSAADRQDAQFAVWSGYASAEDCSDRLSRASNDRRPFDGEAASGCLAHLANRPCGVAPTAVTHIAEEKAGCARVVGGRQAEGQPCDTHDDCKPGLVCPPVRETGLSYCSAPGVANQACIGSQPATAVDHPACQPGLVCSAVGENPAGCPSPPCVEYRCVPLSEEGEPCSGLECLSGLSCRDGVCSRGGPSPAGGWCRILEHCADGLFCDPSVGQCVPRKPAGSACRQGGNSLLECRGTCREGGAGSGVCVPYCSSG